MKLSELRVDVRIKSLENGQVEKIRHISFPMGSFTTEQDIYWSFEHGKRWELYVPEFDGPTDAITHLKPFDYQSLLGVAVDSDDREWFEELCAVINGVGEQHA